MELVNKGVARGENTWALSQLCGRGELGLEVMYPRMLEDCRFFALSLWSRLSLPEHKLARS